MRPMDRMWTFQREALDLAQKHGLLDLCSDATKTRYKEGMITIEEVLDDPKLNATCEADFLPRLQPETYN